MNSQRAAGTICLAGSFGFFPARCVLSGRMSSHVAYIGKNWQEIGIAQVVVWRIRGRGLADMAVFLVDVWCLGVKDVIYDEGVPVAACEAFVRVELPEDFREPFEPACAKALIEGAIAYAERLGFSPHRDFRKGRRVLNGIDAAACTQAFVFGKDGRPCYVPGPDDEDERIDRVLAILSARLGDDGFDYEPHDDEPEDENLRLRFRLRRLLDEQPEGLPRFYAVNGMVMAALLAPNAISPVELVASIWGSEDGPKPESRDALRGLIDDLMRYWNYAAGMVTDALASGDDAVLIDVYEEDFEDAKDEETAGMALIAATLEWAVGFMRIVEDRSEAWGGFPEAPGLAEHWEIVRLWRKLAEGGGGLNAIKEAAEATPSRTLAKSVLAIARASRGAAGETVVR